MSVDREIRQSLERAYELLAGEPVQAIWQDYKQVTEAEVGTWVRETKHALDRFLSLMNERGDPGAIPLAVLASGARGSIARNKSRYPGKGWMIGESYALGEGWVTHRLWLAADGTLFSGGNAQGMGPELDLLEWPGTRTLMGPVWSAVESIPRYIGKILAENGLEWLPEVPRVISGYGPTPRLDGLYVAHEDFGSSYLRFSSGGMVSQVTSIGSPAEVAAWLGPERTDFFQGIYVAEDRELYFGASSPQGLVIFHGQILGATGALELRSRSKINGYRDEKIYTFVALPMC